MRDAFQVRRRHGCRLNASFVLEVGGEVCVREGMDCQSACVVVRGVECACLLHLVELHKYDVGDVIGCGLWDVYVDQDCTGCRKVC